MKIFVVFYFIIALAATCTAQNITIVADEWPPFNGKANSQSEGYMVDIARIVFEAKGIEVKYITMPWKRAIAETKQGTYNAAIGASKTDAVGFVFPEEELARNRLAFYVKKGNIWKYQGIGSIQQVKLGVIAGYDYRQWLNEYIKKNSNNADKIQILTGDIPLQRGLQGLLLDRIDVIVDTEAAILSEAKRLGLSHQIQSAGYGQELSFCYIAFSPNILSSPIYAQILSDGIAELRSKGKLQNILDKYGLTDWRKP
jgi:polar amino acid transport system substrate-binding protein